MLSPVDLPSRMSDSHRLTRGIRSTSFHTARLVSNAIKRNIWIKGLIGLSLPAALLGTMLPAGSPNKAQPTATAAHYAMSATIGAFVGESPLSDSDLALLQDEGVAGTLDFGAPTSANVVSKVAASAANLREGPGISHASLARLPNGTAVTLLERHNDWFRVQTSSGKQGWMSQEVLAVSDEQAARVVVAQDVAAKPVAAVATTTRYSINLRTGPGTQHSSLGKLDQGVKLSVIASQNGWYQVRTASGKTGWVIGDYLAVGAAAETSSGSAATAPAAAVAPTGSTNSRLTNLRQGPGTAYPALARLTYNSKLTLVARHGDWFKVRTTKGTVGWVNGDLITASSSTLGRVAVTNDIPATPKKLTPASTTASTNASISTPGSSKGAYAARVALQQVGRRYIWGGASPRGFDCSGLVMYAYRLAGKRLPHSAAGMYSTRYGRKITSRAALKTGDIVFFAGTAGRKRGITHVALYVGGGRMVSANSPRSGVQLNSINTRYWRSHFVGAIRP